MTTIKNGDVSKKITFVAVDSTDLKTRETGLSSFGVYYSFGGSATEVAMTTPTVTEIGSANMPGVYALDIDESGMVTLGAGEDYEEVTLHITQASMAPVTLKYNVERPKMTAGETLVIANLNKTLAAIGRGTATTGGTTTSVPTSAFSPAGAVADQFKGRAIIFDSDTATSALRGQAAVITASSNAATPVFTVSPLTTAPASGDTFSIV